MSSLSSMPIYLRAAFLSGKAVFPALFVLIAAPLLVYLALFLPLGEAPDEATQIVRAASLLHGQWIGRREVIAHPADGQPFTASGVDANLGYIAALSWLPLVAPDSPKTLTRQALDREKATPWQPGRAFIEASNTANYVPIFYAPAAAGMGIARLFDAGPYSTILAGRFGNVAYYLIVVSLALRFVRRGPLLLFGLAILPMSLHLAAAVSQDGPLIATSVLAAALLGRGGTGHDGKPDSTYWLGIAALACVVAAKPPYLPLALLAFVLMNGAVSRIFAKLLGVVAAAGPAIIWSVLAMLYATVPFWRPPYGPGPLWPGDPAIGFRATDASEQMKVLLSHPSSLLTLPVTSLTGGLVDLACQFVGNLSWLDLSFPGWFYKLWYAALILFVLSDVAFGDVRGWIRERWRLALAVASVTMSIYLIYMVQYVTWTAVGAVSIEGVQGRYFIPLAILSAAFLPVRKYASLVGVRLAFVAAPAIMGLLGFALTAGMITTRYYLH